jgi:predicted component of type VI protein secretion system
MAIRIQLRDPRTGVERVFAFDQSPIRIGRNALNNIVIDDAFVSLWHGMIRFDESSVTYFDLGSTNGSMLEGRRLPKNEARPLPGDVPLVISYFQLLVTAIPSAQEGKHEACTKPLSRNAHSSSGSQLLPPTNRDSEQLSQCLRIVESFSNALVALMKGYQEFGAEVGVRPLCGDTPLHRARTGREVMHHLMDPVHETETRLRDLQAIFADMGIHQLAIMEGITQGLHTLLESLDPSLQEGQSGNGFFSRSRSRTLWTNYCERFSTLIAEDGALHAEIFGEAFARAYASVALGCAERPENSKPKLPSVNRG